MAGEEVVQVLLPKYTRPQAPANTIGESMRRKGEKNNTQVRVGDSSSNMGNFFIIATFSWCKVQPCAAVKLQGGGL